MFGKQLRVAVVVCAVLGLASSASAQSHYFRGAGWVPTAVDNLWSTAANWANGANGFPGVPGAGATIRFETDGTGSFFPLTMDVDYSGGALGYCRFTGAESVSIQNYFKVAYGGTALQLMNGSAGAAHIAVPSSGTIDADIVLGNERTWGIPVIDFTGGKWVAGNVRTYSGGRQGGIIRVSSASGTLTPGAAVITAALETTMLQRPCFDFALANTGVAPITFTAADPLQFTGGAAGTNPFRLTVDMAAYTGGAVSIPLITFSGGTDTDRLFASDAITLSNAPVAGAPWSVVQTDSGVTLTPTGSPTHGDSSWTGGSGTDSNWVTTANWNAGLVPGELGTTGNGDTATFNAAIGGTGNPVMVDATRNVKSITFDTASAAAYTISGSTLALTSGGTIQTTSSVVNTQTVNAPLQIQGASGAAYSFTSGATDNTKLLNFGGAISGVATTGNTTTLTLDGGNTGANTISGAIGDGGAGGKLALTKDGDGTWVLSVANTYSGGTTVSKGTLLLTNANALLAGSDLTIGASGTVVLASDLTGAAATNAGSSVAPVPEPGTIALLAAGLAGLLVAAWRRRR
jgi:autotransporter-associated beta strand protein